MTTQHSTKQRLALAILEFLNTSLTDGTLSSEDKESIDIASGLIADSFHVDPTDKVAVASAVGSQNLLNIYAVYEKLKTATSTSTSTSANTNTNTNTNHAASPPTAGTTPSTEQIAEAESLKSRGNAAMAAKDYPLAISLYTQALDLRPSHAVYLSNRAAAHSASRDHASARADADAAVAADPSYTKGWSRLGLARFALGDAKGAMEAYGRGIEAEGNGGSEVMKKGYETAKKRVDELDRDASPRPTSPPSAGGGMPDLGGLASLLGGGGGAGAGAGAGGGSGGGMEGLAGLMQNPMFANMAQSLMSNPDMMANLMSNPRLREMANQFGGGGGMPDLSSLMSDPRIADMARSLGGGGSGSGSGSGGGAAGSPPPQ